MNTFLANLYLRAIAVRDREEGQTMAEYGIILVLIAVAAALASGFSAARSTTCSAIDQAVLEPFAENGGGNDQRSLPPPFTQRTFENNT